MTSRVRALSVLLICLVSTMLFVPAQQSATYAQEYEMYQKAQQETNAANQKALVLDFVKKFKESQLDEHMAYLYIQHLSPLREAGKWQQVANEAEALLQYRPSNQNAAALATEAYQKLGQPDKLVQFGSKLYSQSPSASTAYLVAKAYQSMNDTANFQKWAERTLKHSPNNPEMLVEMVNAYWGVQNMAQASAYAERALKALAEKPNDKQTNLVRAFAHRAIGENAYVAGDTKTAQGEFEKAAELDPMTDFAHFRLGYCYWRSNRIDNAIRSFAKAVALKGSSGREARQVLYDLLRQQYGNTSSAAKVIKAAGDELGLPN